jgi:hypothetical protein
VPFEAILTIFTAVDQAMQHLSDGASASSLFEDLLVVRQDFDLGNNKLSQVDACQKSMAINALVNCSTRSSRFPAVSIRLKLWRSDNTSALTCMAVWIRPP